MSKESSDEFREALPLLALLALTALAYANGMTGGFIFDDRLLAQHAWAWKPISQWGWGLPNPMGHAAQRPIVTAAFYLDYFLFDKHPTGYHVINLILQMVNVWLCWLLAIRLGLTRRAAWIVAAVFAFHPVQTESVVYISGRRDLLLGFFYLTTFLLYLKYREEKPLWWQITLPIYFFVGMNAKESIFTLPGLFLLYEALLAKNPWRDPPESQGVDSPWRRIWRGFTEYKVMYALIFALGVPLLIHRSFISTHLGYDPTGNLIGGTLGTHTMTALRAQVILLWRLIFPLHLLADYSMKSIAISSGWGDPLGWGAMAVIVALIGSIFWNLSRRPWVAFALSIIVLGLLPTAQIIRHREVTAEHYLYLPCIGFGMLLAMADARLRASKVQNSATVAMIALTVLFSLYVVRCWARNPSYDSPMTFWSTVERDSPQSARAQINLGAHESLTGQYGGAELLKRFERAQEYDPNNAGGYANAGLIYKSFGKNEKAIKLFQRALEIEPRNPDYKVDLARLLYDSGRLTEAWEQLEWVRVNVPGHERMQALRREILLKQAMEARAKS
ncbi:MAG: tetratricopeptide repeat protein, partial [Chrysiogenetes bacterium]|nr:tetratricopeptide repeat protein [Chrysiogenetes bacterium]